jgi:hypothetical protein
MMAKRYAMTVEVPGFDEEAAYDQNRPISSLIRTQLLHLTAAENLALPPRLRTGININSLHTEREAGAYIQRMTALLHKHGKAEARKAATSRKTKPARKRSGKSLKKRPRKSLKKSLKKRSSSSTKGPRKAAVAATSTRKPGAAVTKRKSRQ